jgi:uncharacterized repeat protein (TIGR01451 family)
MVPAGLGKDEPDQGTFLGGLNMTRRATFRLLCVLAGTTGGLAACHTEKSSSTTTVSGGGQTTTHTTTTSSGGMSGGGQMSRSGQALYFPTGQQSGSVVMLTIQQPQQVRLGQPYSYDMTVQNIGTQPLANVTVRELAHESGAATSSITGGTTTGGRVLGTTNPGETQGATQGGTQGTMGTSPGSWNIGTLQPRETRTLHLEGNETQVGTARHCFSVDFTPLTPAACTVVEVVNPQLRLTQMIPQSASACAEIVQRYRIENIGTAPVRNVRVINRLPDGLTTTNGQNTAALDVGDLAPGQTREVQTTLKATRTGDFSMQPMVTSADGGEWKTDAATMSVGAPVLDVAVRAPESQYVADPMKFDIEVTNRGNAPAPNAFVTLEGISMDGGRKDLGTIAPGETKRVTVNTPPPRVTFTGDSSTVPFNFKATATADCAKPVTQAATTQVKTLTSLLFSAVDTVDPVRVGEGTTYVIVVRNQGSAPSRNITLNATLPPEEQFVDGTGATAVSAEGQKVIFGVLPALAPGQEATWRVNVKAINEGAVQFRLEMKSDEMNEPGIKTEPTRLYK